MNRILFIKIENHVQISVTADDGNDYFIQPGIEDEQIMKAAVANAKTINAEIFETENSALIRVTNEQLEQLTN